jgi:hypothetical protein
MALAERLQARLDRLHARQAVHRERDHRGELAALLPHVALEQGLQGRVEAEQARVEQFRYCFPGRLQLFPAALHQGDLLRRHCGGSP